MLVRFAISIGFTTGSAPMNFKKQVYLPFLTTAASHLCSPV